MNGTLLKDLPADPLRPSIHSTFTLHHKIRNGKTSNLKSHIKRKTDNAVNEGNTNFTFMSSCIVKNFFVIKPTRCTNFTNLFCHETLHVSHSSSAHHQEFIHCTLSNSICQWINSWWWTDELSETCRVSWQNKFVKVVHLVGFITKKEILSCCSQTHLRNRSCPKVAMKMFLLP